MAAFVVEDFTQQFYNLSASGSGGGQAAISIVITEEEGGTGYSQDVVADAMRDAVDALAGVTTGTLSKHTETITTVS